MTIPVSIRPYSAHDAQPLFEAAIESVDAINPWMPWCHAAFSIDDAQRWVDSQVDAIATGSGYGFVIEDDNGLFLGSCSLNHLVRLHRMANLGYWVRSSASGRGVATNAVRLLADWAFQNTDFNRLELVVAAGNTASHRVATRAGAVQEAELVDRLWLHGESVDATMFAITRSNWYSA